MARERQRAIGSSRQRAARSKAGKLLAQAALTGVTVARAPSATIAAPQICISGTAAMAAASAEAAAEAAAATRGSDKRQRQQQVGPAVAAAIAAAVIAAVATASRSSSKQQLRAIYEP